MDRIKILDCTLRDGGYVNDWKFGKRVIRSVIDRLDKSGIDIIECGFLTENAVDEDYSLFNDAAAIENFLPERKRNSMFVAMIAIGEKEMNPFKLKACDGRGIEGIRLTFHNSEIEKAMEWAHIIMDKGYKVFMQPVGTISYSDMDLLYLVEKMNQLKPYAFYIVDTLGSMTKNELLYIFYLINTNLNPEIHIGFHAHNNLQLAFSNAQELCRIHTKRVLLIDASVYGMGRAAGNLPTELIAQYINKNIVSKYNAATILDIYDENISVIRNEHEWGYNIPYNIAASNHCHPNYAAFLINKQTLRMKDIENIISSIPDYNKVIYDKCAIEELYIAYQSKRSEQNNSLNGIKKLIKDKRILILAPGKSLSYECDRIMEFINKEKPYVISTNFWDDNYKIDACFVSNRKRIDNIEAKINMLNDVKIIATSNIQFNSKYNCYCVDYYSYINNDDIVFDNSGLMLLKLLSMCDVREVSLAGFDGFNTRYNKIYYNNELVTGLDKSELEEKHIRIKRQLNEMSKVMKITFLTHSEYED